jgi:hypothetical protein
MAAAAADLLLRRILPEAETAEETSRHRDGALLIIIIPETEVIIIITEEEEEDRLPSTPRFSSSGSAITRKKWTLSRIDGASDGTGSASSTYCRSRPESSEGRILPTLWEEEA